MKATMVEFRGDCGYWEWYDIYLHKTPKQAIKDYIDDHCLEEDWEKRLEIIDGALDFQDEVRAYEITLNTSKIKEV